MRILNFGSLNIDEIYRVPHLVSPGETVEASDRRVSPGGKGLNQSIALSRAGAHVTHAGCIGADGMFLKDTLAENSIDVSQLHISDVPTGRAVIQVADDGQNSIVYFPGANRCVGVQYIRKMLSFFGPGEWVLLQNEISGVGEILHLAAERGMHIAFNPSPISADLHSLPLEVVSCLLLNEIEGASLTRVRNHEAMLEILREKYPRSSIVLTVGSAGAYYADCNEVIYQPAVPAVAVDTTGAGDVFTGYLLAALGEGKPPREAMYTASVAAAISITRHGAAASVPTRAEVLQKSGE